MRKLLPLGLLVVSVAVPAVRAAAPPSALSSSPPSAPSSAPPSARERLAALDRSGAAPPEEVAALAGELLAIAPDDPTLLWRRGDALRRLGRDERALAHLTRLIEIAPGSPYAVRARRALPLLLARVGLDREAADADEALVAERLSDPVVVLPRLARTYARLGLSREVLATIARLRALDPSRADGDADLAWLEADARARRDPPRRAAAVLLDFAARFPDDPRRGEALVRAARARGALGELAPALEIADRAVDAPLPRAAHETARVARAELLARGGNSLEAAADLRAVLETASDAQTIERALARYTDLEMERRGTDGALAALAALIAGGRPALAEPARERMAGLLEGLAAAGPASPERAAYLVELASQADPALAVPPALRIAAARLWEEVGDCARAARVYAALTPESPPVGGAAEEGLARCRPEASKP